jgi:flagellar protein FlgJ
LRERQAASSAASSPGVADAGKELSAVAPTTAPTGTNDFVNRVWPHALETAKALGVPPQFIVAHSALESGWGKNEIRAADGSPSYNVFGVKAGSGWQGRTTEVATTEYVDGVAQSVREKFRVYDSYADAFRDYASLLRSNPRFAGVLGQQGGQDFARSLQNSGYATDPAYADKLTRIINGTTLRQALIG